MRIDRLGLVRYGHFTDASVSFARPNAGKPDLHVVFGPNEAGKSTLFSAWLDLLFGIPARTAYNFLHDNRTLRVEGDISAASGALALVRVKGNSNTLLDRMTDAPLPEATLGAALGGLDRDAYTTMFSLDDETLETGGESILASKGSLGELLFAASGGLTELSEALRALHDDGAAWFKPMGRKYQLAALKTRLNDLTAQRKAVDLQVSAWRKLTQVHTQAEGAYQDAAARREATQTKLDQLRRDLDALPMLQRLRRLQVRLAELPQPQALPAEWRSALPDWMRQDAELAVLLPEITQARTDTAQALAQLQDDPAALTVLPRLEILEGQFGAISRQQADLPKRRDELADIQAQMARLTGRLARPDLTPFAATLAPHISQRMSDMIESHAVLRNAQQAAKTELDKAQMAMQGQQDGAALEEDALARLAPLVEQLRRADLLRQSVEAVATAQTSAAAQAQAFGALAPWQGDAAQLAALDLPCPDSLRAQEAALAQAQRDAREALAECTRLQRVVVRLRAEIGTAAAVTAQDASAQRAARDAAWAAHLAALNRDTAAMFEDAMRADDAIMVARLEQARIAERLVVLQQEQAALALAEQQQVAADQQVAQMQAGVCALWATLGGTDAGRSLADLIDWLARRDTALDAVAKSEAARAAQSAIGARLSGAADTLHGALRALGRALDTQDYATLLAEGEAVLAAAERLRHTARLRRELEGRQSALDATQAALRDWQAEWDGLCAATWIGTPAPTPAEMRAILAVVADIAALAPQAEALARRIARITEDMTIFHTDLTQIAKQLDEVPSPDVQILWPRLRARLKGAQGIQATRDRLNAEATRAASRLQGLAQQQARLHDAIAPLQAHFGTDSLAQIDQTIAAITRAAEVSEEISGLRHDLAAHLRVADPVPEIARLEALNPDLAHAEAETLAATLAAQDEALRKAYAELAEAERVLDSTGHDGAAARLEAERQTVLLQITDEAAQFMARQAGVIAVEQALRLYRDTHRSAMMGRAAEAFAMLTAGRYTGLSTQPDGRNEILIAQQASGATKPVDTLSKGTRFQLYLALRAAGYLELAASRPCVPFIADDIMETFDDTRAEAAFRMLAQMAQHGQVIYLTHHAHLCQIAKKACADVQLHDLRAL